MKLLIKNLPLNSKIIYNFFPKNIFATKTPIKLESKPLTFFAHDMGTCLRKLYYKYMGVTTTEEWPAETEFSMELGDAIHAIIVDMAKRKGIWRGNEVRGSIDELNLSYRIDLLINYLDKTIPIEIKSTANWLMAQTPFKKDIAQLQTYLYKDDFEYGLLMYLNRDNCKTKTFVIKPDETYRSEIKRRVETLKTSIATSTPPEREFMLELSPKTMQPIVKRPNGTYTDWECRKCSYMEICWEMVKNLNGSMKSGIINDTATCKCGFRGTVSEWIDNKCPKCGITEGLIEFLEDNGESAGEV